ncbi:hypothetical protein SAMN05720761_12419 [Fibrobacter sp. UWCM]|uniref:hypothetical protein n=1 Tax=Fibrobacter sp. UWCM TaxID=1896208 RepID=UPI000923EDD0|nr:hypothetical protein [Fibrobacter sp. UWCM]SHH73912.1 hypothetical protein SAMN05720761_12419 [Fibrobacter sp. UWCM]
MNIKHLSTAALCAAFAICTTSCSNEDPTSNEFYSIVSTLDPDNCNDKTEGSLNFVKSEATMYACSEGEWVAMNDHEAIQYRCTSKELDDKSGFAIICDGDTIGTIKNGINGKNGVSADTAAINKAIKETLSAASAQNQKDIDEAIKNLSSASAMNQKDINDKFNDAYSSWNAELEDRSCAIVDTVRDNEKAIITVTIRCGEAETKMEIPFTPVNENLAKVYKKHVVVRFPVQANKETKTDDIYEEIWKNLKGGDNAELTVTDLDEKFAPSGKVFMQDLFASANKSFVTIEETNEKAVEYKVARLEGDLDITNLTTPVVKLRVKLNLTNNAFGAFGGFGSNATDVIYNAYADLSDASDTVVIDFLTDYKAARVKKLVDDGNGFGVANEQANKDLAAALYLENSEEYPSFEHYAPDQIGLAENFNSIVWVMALIDQKDKTPSFNPVYNAFRNVFAENGNFNTAVNTTYAGKEHSMFFVDYLALLIDANFFKWNQMQHGDYTAETNVWSGTDAVYYKILQNGFVEAYKLKVEDAKVFNDPSGYSSKVYKSDVKGGYFHYFEYIENEQVWYPVTLWAVGVATVEKVCDADAVNSTFFYSFEGLDDNAVCICNDKNCGWQYTDNVCLGRNIGDKGSAFFDGEIQEYECVKEECNLSASSCDNLGLVPSAPSSSGSSGEYSEQDGITPEEQANNPESKLYLGECSATVNEGKEKLFDTKNAELATATSKTTFVCDGSKWRKKDDHDEEYGICTKTVMEKGEVKAESGSEFYKCDYLDNENKYKWIPAGWTDSYLGKACYKGYVNEKVVTESGYEYVCEENSEYTDNWGNHIHEWRELTFEEIYGECDEDKMKNQTKVAVYEGKKYKCNYISGGYLSGYSWVKASDLDENATLGICTRNRKKDAAIVGDAYYECLNNGNVEGIPASSSSTDWLEINENEYLNAMFDNCDTDRGDTKNIADIKSETLTDGESHSFKCSIAKEVVNDNGKWVDASTDIALDQICNRDNEDATVTKESVIYVCAYKDESSMYQWIKQELEQE